ncbi:MAG: phage tail protein [Streptococcaceae bacterium]|jgi:hypothetical protein|nr:phage tail protein [Streptococcaceae bacterium]
MVYKVDFKDVSSVGFESVPVAESFAGLRANEARYFWNKYTFEYVTYPAAEQQELADLMTKILKEERDLAFSAKMLEVAPYEDDEKYWHEFYYDNGMCLNLLYEKSGEKPKRAIGIKLSVGMEIPEELAAKGFKFARQRSKLAGEVRGSFFTLKKEWF